jgi:DNA-binding CsgD family transcriptional regulator
MGGARRIEVADRRVVRALIDSIERYSETPILETITAELPSLLGAEVGCAYRVGLQTNGWNLDLVHVTGADPSFAPMLARYAATASTACFSAYDALQPPKGHRNRGVNATSLLAPGAFERLPMTEQFFRPQRLDKHTQLRVLVCDGPLLLAWVGVLGTGRYGAREPRLLSRLARPLVTRLRLEQRLHDAEVQRRGLEAALELLDAPAFLMRGAQAVVHANAPGRVLLDARSIDLPHRVRAARAGLDPAVSVIPLAVRALESYTLVLIAEPQPDLRLRVGRAARGWQLTARQAEVLGWVVQGESNKLIAERLRCMENTIEVHVSAILRKAHVQGRAMLAAKFWRETVA